MKTGLSKKQKTTAIFFDEESDITEVMTHNTDLKKSVEEIRREPSRPLQANRR